MTDTQPDLLTVGPTQPIQKPARGFAPHVSRLPVTPSKEIGWIERGVNKIGLPVIKMLSSQPAAYDTAIEFPADDPILLAKLPGDPLLAMRAQKSYRVKWVVTWEHKSGNRNLVSITGDIADLTEKPMREVIQTRWDKFMEQMVRNLKISDAEITQIMEIAFGMPLHAWLDGRRYITHAETAFYAAGMDFVKQRDAATKPAAPEASDSLEDWFGPKQEPQTITVDQWLFLPAAERPHVLYGGEAVETIYRDPTYTDGKHYVISMSSHGAGSKLGDTVLTLDHAATPGDPEPNTKSSGAAEPEIDAENWCVNCGGTLNFDGKCPSCSHPINHNPKPASIPTPEVSPVDAIAEPKQHDMDPAKMVYSIPNHLKREHELQDKEVGKHIQAIFKMPLPDAIKKYGPDMCWNMVEDYDARLKAQGQKIDEKAPPRDESEPTRVSEPEKATSATPAPAPALVAVSTAQPAPVITAITDVLINGHIVRVQAHAGESGEQIAAGVLALFEGLRQIASSKAVESYGPVMEGRDSVTMMKQEGQFLPDPVTARLGVAANSSGAAASPDQSYSAPASRDGGTAACVLIEIVNSYNGGKPQLTFNCDGLEHPLRFTKAPGEMVKLLNNVRQPGGQPFTIAELQPGRKFGGSWLVDWERGQNQEGKFFMNVLQVRPAA